MLARLALRAGDITALRIGDIDWNRAEIRVSGKSRRQTALPLPQEVGDALYHLMKARRTIDGLPLKEQKVFLGSLAAYRPFNAASTVTSIVRFPGVEPCRGRHPRRTRRARVSPQSGHRFGSRRRIIRGHLIAAAARFHGHHHDLC